MDKYFITAQQLLEDSFKLGSLIFDSGFKPDFIIGVWRGGTPVGIAVQELLEFKGVDSDHIAIRTSSYTGINQQSDTIKVHGLHYIIEEANSDDSLLIVDDVFDTGRSIDAIFRDLKTKTRRNMPGDIRTACPWFKPGNNKVNFEPDYYIHKTDKWLVFPHELQGLTDEEIRAGKPEISDLLLGSKG